MPTSFITLIVCFISPAEHVEVVITEVQDGDLVYSICSYDAENEDAMNLVEGERVYILG